MVLLRLLLQILLRLDKRRQLQGIGACLASHRPCVLTRTVSSLRARRLRKPGELATSVFTTEQTRTFAVSSICCGAHVQPQPQKKVARVHRIDGSIVLYRSARNLFKAERSLLRAEPWWSVVFGAPLFVRALLRLVFVCPHWHKGPPLTLRESVPSNLPGWRPVYGRETYITCLDCGQKFAYNSKTRRLIDFWGVHDAEALAGVRRRVVGFFSPLRGLVARVGRLNMRIPMSEVVRSLHRLGILTKGQ
jgi:hypothetical protein